MRTSFLRIATWLNRQKPSLWWRVCALLVLVCLLALDGAGRAHAADSEERAQPVAGTGFAATPGNSTPVPASRQATNLAIITIHGPIDAITVASVKRRLESAANAGADGIVFDIDSPGGEVGAVVEISRMIKLSPVTNTVAWVNPDAYSGGAVLAMACRQIVLAPGATMGDIGVIGGDPLGFSFFQGLKPTERAKALSVVLPEVIDSARANGYDEMLVQGFVTLGVELWLIRDKQTGAEYFVSEQEYRTIFGTIPPEGTARIGSIGLGTLNAKSEAAGEGRNVDFGEMDNFERNKLPQSDQHMKYRPASPELSHENMERAFDLSVRTRSTRPFFSAGDADRYEFIEYATDGNTLLTMKETELKRYGFADPAATIANDSELQQYMGSTNLLRLDQTWSENLVAFMTMGGSGLAVRGLLIVVFLLALFIEMASPGIGLPGMVAVIALAGLIVPPMLIGASNWWAAVAVMVGILLIVLEVFVFPGFGVPGVMGMLLLMAGLVGAFAGVGEMFPGSSTGNGTDLAWAMAVVTLAIFVAGTGAYFFSRYTHKFPIMGRLVLTSSPASSDEDSSSLLMVMSPSASENAASSIRIGQIGKTSTPLRPSGTAEFGDALVDVVSEFGFVDAAMPVRVVSVTPFRVGVEPVRNAGSAGEGLKA